VNKAHAILDVIYVLTFAAVVTRCYSNAMVQSPSLTFLDLSSSAKAISASIELPVSEQLQGVVP